MVATGKGVSNFGKAATGKGFSNFGKGKDPFLGKERILSFPRKGVVCNWERFQSFWERKGSFPFPEWSKGKLRKGKGKDSYPPIIKMMIF